MASKLTIPYKSELIAIAIVFISFVLVKGKLKETDDKLASIAKQIEVCGQNERLAAGWNSVAGQLEESLKGFIFEDSISIKKVFQDAAWSANVNINSIRTTQNVTGVVGEGILEASLSCDYKNFVNLINALEAAKIRINNISIVGTGRDKGINIIVQSFFNKNNG